MNRAMHNQSAIGTKIFIQGETAGWKARLSGARWRVSKIKFQVADFEEADVGLSATKRPRYTTACSPFVSLEHVELLLLFEKLLFLLMEPLFPRAAI